MSWYIKTIGLRAGVKAAVLANSQMPDGVKATVCSILDEEGAGGTLPNGRSVPFDGARVEGYGHCGGGDGSIGKLEVEMFLIAQPPRE